METWLSCNALLTLLYKQYIFYASMPGNHRIHKMSHIQWVAHALFLLPAAMKPETLSCLCKSSNRQCPRMCSFISHHRREDSERCCLGFSCLKLWERLVHSANTDWSVKVHLCEWCLHGTPDILFLHLHIEEKTVYCYKSGICMMSLHLEGLGEIKFRASNTVLFIHLPIK